jgi:hypothetical protein
LIVILAAGGWYLTKGPGTANLGQILTQAKQKISHGSFGQSNGVGPPPATTISTPIAPAPAAATPLFGGPAVRLASFNIQAFGDAKAAKPYVMATLAAIIHNFHLVAIQEIRTQDDYLSTTSCATTSIKTAACLTK